MKADPANLAQILEPRFPVIPNDQVEPQWNENISEESGLSEANLILDGAPGEPAKADDQGDSSTCTPRALSKATVDGYEDGIFHPKKLDFKQTDATEKLIILHPEGQKMSGVWPIYYDKKTISLTEQRARPLKRWNVTYNITRIIKEHFIKSDVPCQNEDGSWHKMDRKHTYVMVIYTTHTVYIQEICSHTSFRGIRSLIAVCLNSHKDNSKLFINVHSKGNTFYQVRCSANECKDNSDMKPSEENVKARLTRKRPILEHSMKSICGKRLMKKSNESEYIKSDNLDCKNEENPSVCLEEENQNDSSVYLNAPKGGGFISKVNENETELIALSRAISETPSFKTISNQQSQSVLLEKLKAVKTEDTVLLQRFNNTKFDIDWPDVKKSLKVEVIEMTIKQLLQENPKHTSECKYILHYPVDKPDGVKKFAFIPEVFELNGYTIGYCEEDDHDEDEFINLSRKGNRFYKIISSIVNRVFDICVTKENITELNNHSEACKFKSKIEETWSNLDAPYTSGSTNSHNKIQQELFGDSSSYFNIGTCLQLHQESKAEEQEMTKSANLHILDIPTISVSYSYKTPFWIYDHLISNKNKAKEQDVTNSAKLDILAKPSTTVGLNNWIFDDKEKRKEQEDTNSVQLFDSGWEDCTESANNTSSTLVVDDR